MATRSIIGKQNSDGTITSIYCHWDGYPANNGSLLVDNYATPILVDQLIALGDLSYLGASLRMTHAYTRDMKRVWEQNAPQTGERSELNELITSCDADYIYIYGEDMEWECFKYDGTHMKLLSAESALN